MMQLDSYNDLENNGLFNDEFSGDDDLSDVLIVGPNGTSGLFDDDDDYDDAGLLVEDVALSVADLFDDLSDFDEDEFGVEDDVEEEEFSVSSGEIKQGILVTDSRLSVNDIINNLVKTVVEEASVVSYFKACMEEPNNPDKITDFRDHLMKYALNYAGSKKLSAPEMQQAEINYRQKLSRAMVAMFDRCFSKELQGTVEQFFVNTINPNKVNTSDMIEDSLLQQKIIAVLNAIIKEDKKRTEAGGAASNIWSEANRPALINFIVDELINSGSIKVSTKEDSAGYSRLQKDVDTVVNIKQSANGVNYDYAKNKCDEWFFESRAVTFKLFSAGILAPQMINMELAPIPVADKMVAGSGYEATLYLDTKFSPVSQSKQELTSYLINPVDTIYDKYQNHAKQSIVGVANLTLNNADDMTDSFGLHEMFGLMKIKGYITHENRVKFIAQCDCGHNLFATEPFIRAYMTNRTSDSNKQYQVFYVPVVCPHCLRIGLLEEQTIDSIELSIKERINKSANGGINIAGGKGILNSMSLYRFSPSVNLTSEAYSGFDGNGGAGARMLDTDVYKNFDLTRHIAEYKNALNQFKLRDKIIANRGKRDLGYNICEMLCLNYKSYKRDAVNSVLYNWLESGVINYIPTEVVQQLKLYWSPSDIDLDNLANEISSSVQRHANLMVSQSDTTEMDLMGEERIFTGSEFTQPNQLLAKATREDKEVFINRVCKDVLHINEITFTPEMNVDAFLPVIRDSLYNYKEVQEDEVLKNLESNYIQYSFGGLRPNYVNLAPFSGLMKDPRFFAILDKTSELLLINHLAEDILRILYNTPHCPEIAALYSTTNIDDAMRKYGTAWGKVAERFNISDDINYYKTLYPEAGLDHNKEAYEFGVRLKQEAKNLARLQFVTENCAEPLELLTVLRNLYSKPIEDIYEDVYKNCVNIRSKLLDTDTVWGIMKEHIAFKPFVAAVQDVAASTDDWTKLVNVRKYTHVFKTAVNMFQFMIDRDEQYSLLICDLNVQYMEDNPLVQLTYLQRLGLDVERLIVSNTTIQDFVDAKISNKTLLEQFLIHMPFPIKDMNYTDVAMDEYGFAVERPASETASDLLSSYMSEVAPLIPEQYYSIISDYLGG